MSEIKINVEKIDVSITKLQKLKSKCILNSKTPPETVGGGQTVNELETIANEYRNIDSHLELLVSNTISFLQNVKNSYITSDQKAAKGINGE